ncbi:MAG TPA: hypothetical protein VGW38_04945 [Chloroflexota bacterium]|nr:hypothetical protein [Chloroflexota bacterium]
MLESIVESKYMVLPARRRIVLTFLDQSVSSVSNFVTGIAIARLSGAAAFGQYMLVLMLWFVVVGLHRAIITEPVIVASPHAEDGCALQKQGVGAELGLGVSVSACVAAAGLALSSAGVDEGRLMLAFSPWFVPLLLQDYWRAMAFKERRPGRALINDTVFACVQFAGIGALWALDLRSAGFVVGAWGVGATAGAVQGWLSFGRPTACLTEGPRLVRRLWPVSRWMAAEFVTGFASNQAYLGFAAFLLSAVDYGGYRAALNLLGPIVVILHASGNVGLPEASRRADPDDPSALRHLARRLSLSTALCVAVYGGIVVLFGRSFLRFLYGPEFTGFGLFATLAAVQALLAAFVFGETIALKATGRMRRLWRVRLIVTAASLVSMYVLVGLMGAIGAGWAGVATAVYYALGTYMVYRAELRRPDSKAAGLKAVLADSRSVFPATSSEDVF